MRGGRVYEINFEFIKIFETKQGLGYLQVVATNFNFL